MQATNSLKGHFPLYLQYRTFDFTYQFRREGELKLSLKIFDLNQNLVQKIRAPNSISRQWSKLGNAQSLLKFFIQQNLIPSVIIPDSIPERGNTLTSGSVRNCIPQLQELIKDFKKRISFVSEGPLKTANCPITLEPFIDPVIDEHGHTFEKKDIEIHLLQNGGASPINREPIHALIPERTLADIMDAARQADPIPTFSIFKKAHTELCNKNLELARAYFAEEEYFEALNSYSRAFVYTNDWRQYAEIPKIYEKMGEPNKEILAYLYLALYQFQDQKVEEAFKTLECCKTKDPSFKQIDDLLRRGAGPDPVLVRQLERAADLSKSQPQEAIKLYKQLLTYNPLLWNAYMPLCTLLAKPQEITQLCLKGACHALATKEYKIAQFFVKEAEKFQESLSILDYLVIVRVVKKVNYSDYRKKLLELVDKYKQKQMKDSMVKIYKILTTLEYDRSYFQAITDNLLDPSKKKKWILRWLTAAMDSGDQGIVDRIIMTLSN